MNSGGPAHAHWRGGPAHAYTDAGDAWAHAADDVMALALGEFGPSTGAGAAGTRVLDVGTGSGPAALAAARAGATAVGLDREPRLLRLAEDRARDTGLGDRTRFVVGDAMSLPFPADAFDVVVSTFGVMFAPDPVRCAAELVRVCRPGGLVAVASWTPDGVMGRIAPTVTRRPPESSADDAPTRWGDPGHVLPWFDPLPVSVRTRVCRVRVSYPSIAAAVRIFENKPGPLRAHRAALEAAGQWSAARAALAALFADHNTATDGRLVWDVPYLLVLGRVAGPDPA